MLLFDWPVDRDGYEWAADAGAGWVLRRRGGPNKFYRPLEDNPGLFRRFAALPVDKDAILDFTNNYGFLEGDNTDEYFIFDKLQDQLRRFKIVVSSIDEGSPERAAAACNSLLHPRFRMWIDLGSTPSAMQVIPTTLYTAMMVQAAQEICGIAKFRKCRQCPEWFPLGKNQATLRREFCSDRCRVAWHRHHRQGGGER